MGLGQGVIFFVGPHCSSVSPYKISLPPLGSCIIVLFSFLFWSVIAVCLSVCLPRQSESLGHSDQVLLGYFPVVCGTGFGLQETRVLVCVIRLEQGPMPARRCRVCDRASRPGGGHVDSGAHALSSYMVIASSSRFSRG